MMGPAAIRKALQFAYKSDVAMFHVHIMTITGPPWFSDIDLRETNNFVPDFLARTAYLSSRSIGT